MKVTLVVTFSVGVTVGIVGGPFLVVVEAGFLVVTFLVVGAGFLVVTFFVVGTGCFLVVVGQGGATGLAERSQTS